MKRSFNLWRFLIVSILGTVGIVFIFHFNSIDNIQLNDFIPVFTVFIIFGIKDFRKYLKYQKSIDNGISLVQNSSNWHFDNLIISSKPENSNQLVVRNDLLWIEKYDNENQDNLLSSLISDFDDLIMSRNAKMYFKDKSVEFRLYSSDPNEEKILKTKVKNYGSQHVV